MQNRQYVIFALAACSIFTSLLFQNCSFKLSSQSMSAENSSAVSLSFDGVDGLIQFTELPATVSPKLNEVIRYKILNTKSDYVFRVEYKLNDGDWTENVSNEIGLTGLSNGEQKISVRAISKDGSISSPAAYTWFVDNLKPQIIINSKPDYFTIDTSAQVVFTVIDSSIFQTDCWVNQVVVPNCKTVVNLENLTEGMTYDVTIKATDIAGNFFDQNVSFTVVLPPTTLGPTYSSLNQNIFMRKCAGCHNSILKKGEFDISLFSNVLARVVPGRAIDSLIYKRVTGLEVPRMPAGGSMPLSTEELQAIEGWINAGAQNN